MLKNFSTSRTARAARLRYWNDLNGGLLAPVEIKARDRNEFEAAASTDELGFLRFVKTESAPASVEHEAHHVEQTKSPHFRALLSVRGRLVVRHAGHESVLDEADFTLLDDAVPYRIDFDAPTEFLCVAVSPSMMETYLPAPARVCGLRMSAERPLNRVASTMLLGIWEQIESDELSPEHRPALARSLLQVFAAAYAVNQSDSVEGSVVAAGRRSQVKRYIETHLRSPDLTPTTIAAALGLSRRYVRMLFAAEKDSVTAYIRRRRLEECAWELAQPQWRGRSITETASDWGFRSVTHFARAFKVVYGATPSSFKHSRTEAAAE